MSAQTAEEPKPKLTLAELLYRLNAADSGLLDLSIDDLGETAADLATKVDSYKYVDDKFDAEIARLGERIKELSAAKQSLMKNKARLREFMAVHMLRNEFTKLPGEVYAVSLTKRKDVELSLGTDPDAIAYRNYPGFVTRSYSWDKTAVKKAILDGAEGFATFGTVVEKASVRFTIRKDINR